MTGRQVLIAGSIAAGVFWLLTRSRAAVAAGVGWEIETTKGQRLQLQERNGIMYDQHGGMWT